MCGRVALKGFGMNLSDLLIYNCAYVIMYKESSSSLEFRGV